MHCKIIFGVAFGVVTASVAAETVCGSGAPRQSAPLKVLMIGNSFTGSVMRETPQLAKSAGLALDIVQCGIGGCPFDRHWENVEKASDRTFKPYGISPSFSSDTGREFPKRANVTEMLVAEKWDIVTIQQASGKSAFYDTYQPYADNLIAKIRELAPQAEIVIQETWSYSPYEKRLEKWKMTPKEMYESLRSAYGQLAARHKLRTIPTGDAVQLFRERLPVDYGRLLTSNDIAAIKQPGTIDFHGDVTGSSEWRKGRKGKQEDWDEIKLRADFSHLNARGHYLQACVWAGFLFNVDPTTFTYRPESLPEADAKLMRECARDALNAAAAAHTDIQTVSLQDSGEALVNPGMGLVHYHYSNRLWAYGMYSKPGDTEPLPGTSVVYMRVLWNDLEPKEGKFCWDIFDSVAQNWIKAGKQVAFRIICCNQTENATPDWVREAGAKGVWFPPIYAGIPGAERWEPTYDDPVFLEKLANFLKAFAARYDGDPSVAFVDIGSFGLFGEGHTGRTAKLSREETLRIARIHIELHKRLLPNTFLVLSDDVAGGNSKEPDLPFLQYMRERGVGLRDDSIMCNRYGWYHDHWGRLFAPVLPVILETGHVTMCAERGNWRKERILEAVEKHQASFFTFHGFPEDFRESHASEIAAVNRRIGYRLLPVEVSFPKRVKRGEQVDIAAKWVNKGVAPCLPGGFVAWSLCDSEGNVCWSFTDETFDVRALAPTLEGGESPMWRISRGRFGYSAPIPPWNDMVLAGLRKSGRVTERSFDMLAPGKYALCVSVGSRQGTPKIALPLAGGTGLRYQIGHVTMDENGDITSVKYEPLRDINGQPLVRKVEPEDLDNIGEAVMANIVDGV